MDWSTIELVVYGTEPAESLFCLPEDGTLHHLRLEPEEDGFVLSENPWKAGSSGTCTAVSGRGAGCLRVGFVGLGIMACPWPAT